MSNVITPEKLRQFKEDGFFILEKVIPSDQLETLRGECDKFMNQADASYYAAKNAPHKEKTTEEQELLQACEAVAKYKIPFRLEDVQLVRAKTTESELRDLPGIRALPRDLYELDNSIGISHPGKRYFISFKFLESDPLHKFLFGDITRSICNSVMGEGFLFLEQFVVKGPEVGMKFGWHQDSGYIPYEHDPYVTCWCALDDMSEENGTIYVQSFSKNPSYNTFLTHQKETGSNDMVCFGNEVPLESGIPMKVPAGSIVVFSSLTPHASGFNKSSKMRRAYIVQYSHHPINARAAEIPELGGPRHFAEKV